MNPRRILVPISILVALALVLLFLCLRPTGVKRTIDSPAVDEHHATPHSPIEGEQSSSGERAHVAATTQLPRSPDFDQVEGVRLVIVDADSRDPVQGAVVHVFVDESGRLGPTSNYEHSMGPDVTAFIAAHGTRFVSDAEGAVDLPVVRTHRFVTARKADKSALVEVDAALRGLFEIRIRPTRDLDVHVRDGEGKPVKGAPIGIYPWSDSSSLSESVTDDDGSCRFTDFGSLVHASDFVPEGLIVVRLALPLEPFVEEWIDPEHIPQKPIELILPPSGSLVVSIVDEDHHVVPVPGTIFLFSDEATLHTRLEPSRATSDTRIPFEDGVARIDGIGLGQELGMNVAFRGEGESGAVVRGPSKAGEVVFVEVEFQSRHTLLRGKVVDDSHNPLARTSFQWLRSADDGRTFKAAKFNTFETDRDGRFVWSTLRTPDPNIGPFTHRDAFLCEVSSAKDRRQARLKLPLEFADGLTDLGDIVVSSGPPLVSGRVVDAQGRAIPDAVVSVYGAASAQGDAGSGYPPCLTDDDGDFVIFGPCLDLPLALGVRREKTRERQSLPIACTGEPVTITMKEPATATLRGTALVDRRALVDELEVMFVASEGGPVGPFSANVWRAGDRVCFGIPDLPLTAGRVELNCPSASPPLHLVVAGISLVKPGETRLAQLSDLDLRGKLPLDADDAARPAAEIEIVNADGKPIPRGLLWEWSAGGEDATQSPWTNGRARILQMDTTRVEIWAAGFREKVLQPVPRSGQVVLEPEIEVELHVEVPHEFHDAGVTLRGVIVFAKQADTEFMPSSLNGDASFVLDREGRAVVRLPAAGPFQVSLSYSRTGVPGMDDIESSDIAVLPTPLVVSDVAGRQSFDCKLDPSGVEQALESLKIGHR
jgi:hypothetical protein